MRRGSLLVSVGVAALALAAPTLAVTGGTIDGGAHPAVGLLLADRGQGPEPDCSGSLVSSTVFVTAAHCTTGIASNRVWVSFAPQYVPGVSLLPGTIHADPLWGAVKDDSHDLAVVVLDAPVAVEPLSLPSAGALDSLDLKSQSFTNVGFGYFDRLTGGGAPQFAFDGFRRWSTSEFSTLKATELNLADKPGGVCFGDSGGPRLLGATIVAITSRPRGFGNQTCNGPSVSYRLDTPSARGFLSGFVTLP